jgi:hypothetical protein
MSNLLPIPEESRTARDIARMEEVLRRLRQVAVGAGMADSFQANDHTRGGRGVKFSELFTANEGQWDFQRFYNYWAIEQRSNRWAHNHGYIGAGPGPQWVRFGSEDRLAWGRLMPELLQALAGLPVSVTFDNVWRWDYKNQRPKGQPTYIPCYEAMVLLRAENTPGFQPEALTQALLAKHCMVDHPLADAHLFDWQEDFIGQTLFHSYGWNRDGFSTEFYSKRGLEEACEALFKGLKLSVEKQGKERRWRVCIDLSASPPEALRRLADTMVTAVPA